MKKMLINATHSEEIRVAIIDTDNQELIDLIYEKENYQTKIGNIYKGKITSLEPSLDAAFVDFGADRHGFLPLKEIAYELFKKQPDSSEKINISDVMELNQEIMIQLEKEERGSKGAALTTFISLAGSYLVLMPNNPRAGGISRRIEGSDRDEMRDLMASLQAPEGMGLILRTAGVGKSPEELQWDLNLLLKQWEAIKSASDGHAAPFLIHKDSDMITRALRDYLRQDISEIWIDNQEILDKVGNYVSQVRPDFMERVKYYDKLIPLFNYFQIEHQIEAAHKREVRLKSGGSIVIDHSEALVSIDINSSRATKGSDIEDTAYNTNVEAAKEIARQLRIRDIGGLIVIDFIDMSSIRHQRDVEAQLREAVKQDRARVRIGHISQFGLLEMSRQRLRPSLGESSRVICPRCDGWGTIRSVESLAMSILRIIKEDAIKTNVVEIQVTLPIDIAAYMSNEKRTQIISLEHEHSVRIILIPHKDMQSPHYQIKSVTENERASLGHTSYRLMPSAKVTESDYNMPRSAPVKPEQPAVKNIYTSANRSEMSKKPDAPSLFKRIIATVFGGSEAEKAEHAATTETKSQSDSDNRLSRSTSSSSSHRQNPNTRQRSRRSSSSGSNRRRSSGSSAASSSSSSEPAASQARGVRTSSSNTSGNKGRRRNTRGVRKRSPRNDVTRELAEPQPSSAEKAHANQTNNSTSKESVTEKDKSEN